MSQDEIFLPDPTSNIENLPHMSMNVEKDEIQKENIGKFFNSNLI